VKCETFMITLSLEDWTVAGGATQKSYECNANGMYRNDCIILIWQIHQGAILIFLKGGKNKNHTQ